MHPWKKGCCYFKYNGLGTMLEPCVTQRRTSWKESYIFYLVITFSSCMLPSANGNTMLGYMELWSDPITLRDTLHLYKGLNLAVCLPSPHSSLSQLLGCVCCFWNFLKTTFLKCVFTEAPPTSLMSNGLILELALSHIRLAPSPFSQGLHSPFQPCHINQAQYFPLILQRWWEEYFYRCQGDDSCIKRREVFTKAWWGSSPYSWLWEKAKDALF